MNLFSVSRPQVPSLGQNPAQGHQARQLAREQQLRVEGKIQPLILSKPSFSRSLFHARGRKKERKKKGGRSCWSLSLSLPPLTRENEKITRCCWRTDLRLRPGPSRGAGSEQAHDPGSGDAVLSRTGNPDGGATLHGRRGRLERRLHFRGAASSQDPFPGAEPRATGKSFPPHRHTVLPLKDIYVKDRQFNASSIFKRE